jgi:ribosomal protein S18 acetylase RimI-like enzyme
MHKITPYDLYKQLMEMHHSLDPIAYPTKRISKKYFNEKLLNETVVKVEDELDNLIGIALYYINKKNMTVTTFVIDNRHRGLGYGKKLMADLNSIAKKKKCKTISLSVSSKNSLAQDFYLKNEFKFSSMTMYKELKYE